MLLRFRFSNYRSFRDEQELSLIAGPFSDHAEAVFHAAGLTDGVLPAAAIYGANASGKTNVIRALRFMASAVNSSQREWKPDAPIAWDPFAMAAESKRAQSRFELDLLLKGTRYQYGFALRSQGIQEEWLFAFPKGKKQTWFLRRAGKPILFGAKMPGENRAIEGLTRENSLFLSAAAQNNHQALKPVYAWFWWYLSFVVGERRGWIGHTAALCEEETEKELVSQFVIAADLGIERLDVEEGKTGIRSVRRGKDGTYFSRRPSDIKLVHRGGNLSIPFEREQESEGTLAYLALLAPIVSALKIGAVVCVDELDASLHPLLAVQIIRLFNDSTHNPNHAQLIFNTHDTNLLSSDVLRRDEIWFTEKKDDGSSQLYPLSDFKPRKHENLENGYLQGRYGAIPFLNPDSFLASLGNGNETA